MTDEECARLAQAVVTQLQCEMEYEPDPDELCHCIHCGACYSLHDVYDGYQQAIPAPCGHSWFAMQQRGQWVLE